MGACFNPRPPLLAGDATGAQCLAPAVRVSIRARHCWWAMRDGLCNVGGRKLFQSAPAIAGGRCARALIQQHEGTEFQSAPAIAGGRCTSAPNHRQRAPRFQSAPAIAGGRCQGAFSMAASTRSFNPRPPLLAGDATQPRRSRRCQILFQSAPAIAGGRCHHLHNVARYRAVSIRARHCWRAML